MQLRCRIWTLRYLVSALNNMVNTNHYLDNIWHLNILITLTNSFDIFNSAALRCRLKYPLKVYICRSTLGPALVIKHVWDAKLVTPHKTTRQVRECLSFHENECQLKLKNVEDYFILSVGGFQTRFNPDSYIKHSGHYQNYRHMKAGVKGCFKVCALHYGCNLHLCFSLDVLNRERL